MKTVLWTSGIILSLLVAAYLWFNYWYIGRKPWNDHVYRPDEILLYAAEQGLLSQWNTYLVEPADRLSLDIEPGDSVRAVPLYRVFDRNGYLLRQHCCFESIPGFIDSTRTVNDWATVDSTKRLARYVNNLRNLHDSRPLVLGVDPSTEFTILYYWDNTLGYNMRKLQQLIRHLNEQSVPQRLVLVNINTVREAQH